MVMLFSEHNTVYDLISSKTDVKKCSYDTSLEDNQVLCFYFNEICKAEIEMIQNMYSNHRIIFIIDRSVAFYFFNFITPSNTSYILLNEIHDQFDACFLSVKSGGIYISKYFKDVLAIRKNTAALTDREVDVVELLKEGHSYKEIAEITHLQYGTVRNYVSRILEITEFNDKTQLAIHFQKFLKDKDFKY